MRKRYLGLSMIGAVVLLVISASSFLAQRQRNRPAASPPPVSNLKVTYKTTMGQGQSSESTTMIRGPRERSEMHLGPGLDIVSLTQCDLKRTIQFSDKARKYVVTPMEAGNSSSSGGAEANDVAEPAAASRGGVITYVMTSTDTGERKEMFGFNARHVKTVTSMESSPDACSQLKQRIETDGWYIDFSATFNCELGRTGMMASRPPRGGCQDRVRSRRVGTGRTGFPLIETTTMYGADGRAMFTSTKEVLELSREPLDAGLFEVPNGYVETTNSQELYGMPSMDANSQVPVDNNQSGVSNAGNVKAPGTIRVGVVQINNKTDHQVSEESLRERLKGNIQGSGVETISLNATSPREAETEAKAKQCDFILYTDITTLKTSAAKKLGGMFGRAAGVGGIDKTESKIEFRLFAVSEPSPRLQSSAVAKEEGDEASAGTAIDQEAKVVSVEVRKKNRS
ncbi:MAG: hypothetical protein M3Y84_09890 [Acidobacteriota bacterium]|nr:hypothetical protein [Acidobacteriota bacterium]